jgi:phage baseplate assembly protein gpV
MFRLADVGQGGIPFHGEFSSADASALNEANSRVLLYRGGSVAAYTLAATERVVITDFDVVCGASGLTVTLYDGDNTTVAAGETINKGTFAANGGISSHLTTPHFCQLGTWPKVKTSGAGQIDVTIRGVIVTG